MSLEEEIVAWSRSRPKWQQAVMKRVAIGALLSEADFSELVGDLIAGKDWGDASFSLADLPATNVAAPAVRLISIEKLQHVNALASDKPLNVEPTGLTLVYGDNASGKSGYARMLKRIIRARHQEDVLSDVFRDSALERPKALLRVAIGDEEASVTWPDAIRPELKRMLFYDQACGQMYVAGESDFPYRPAALFVMDGLIHACDAIRVRIDAKLAENAAQFRVTPPVEPNLTTTEVGRFLTGLSANSSISTLDLLIERAGPLENEIERLRSEEGHLRASDTSKERQRLHREAEKVDAVRREVTGLLEAIGEQAVQEFGAKREELRSLRLAVEVLRSAFAEEPLPGVAGPAWMSMWLAAERFSADDAYPEARFPFTGFDARCVLCLQPLSSEATARLMRFKEFVERDVQTRVAAADAAWQKQIITLGGAAKPSDALNTHLEDLEADNRALVEATRRLLQEYEAAHRALLDAIQSGSPLPVWTPSGDVMAQLGQAADAKRQMLEALSNQGVIAERLAATTLRIQELELIKQTSEHHKEVTEEIGRRKVREVLEAIKNAAATAPITKKVVELSESGITDVVRDSFVRETDRLCLERVTIEKKRVDKGSVLHQPKLVGARQNVSLPRVFSEGERTALGLAAFFTEANLDGSKSALVLDDPVTSLDHIRRGLVAARLAAFAETRQVAVFTHDVSFVADLKREATQRGVPVGERTVTRARGGERKPGLCLPTHPWKAKDVQERLGELRADLARIRRDSPTWDDDAYETAVAAWAGNLSETWERIFSQEIVGQVVAEGGLEVRPRMVKVLTKFSEIDEREFEGSYSRVSLWTKRHDKSGRVNFVAPSVGVLEDELALVDRWFKRIKSYR